MSEAYAMPMARLGQIVYWHEDADEGSPPSPAMVTKLGDNALELAIVQPGSFNLQPMSGVPHVKDPRNRTMLDRAAGSWQSVHEWHDARESKTAAQPAPKRAKSAGEAIGV